MGKTITDRAQIMAMPLPLQPNPEPVTIGVAANLADEYVQGGQWFWNTAGAMVAPWTFDDLTSDFGDNIYERMLWDPSVKAAHTIWKKALLADGGQVIAAPQDPTEKWRQDRKLAMDAFRQQEESRQASIDGAVDDPLHVPDPANPAPPAKIPAPQPKIPPRPRPPTRQQEIAQFCERLLARVDPPFADVLDNLMDAGANGCKVAEKIWEYVDTGEDAGRWMLKAIKPKPRRATAFVVDRYLNIVGVLNVKPGVALPIQVGSAYMPYKVGGEDAVLPREKFVVYTNEPKDSDPRGSSRLRAAYTPWWGKQQLYPEYLKYLAQFGSPSIVGYTSPGASTVMDNSTNPPTTRSAQQSMVNTLTGWAGGKAFSFPYGSKVEIPAASMSGRNFQDDFNHFNEEIFVAILTSNPNASRQGKGEGQVHQDTFAQIVRADKRSLERVIVRDILTPAVLYNFGEGARDMIPSYSLGGANQPDRAAELASVGQLGYALSPSQFGGLDAHYGFPPRSQDELDALTRRAIQGVDPTPAPSDRMGNRPPPPAGGNRNMDNNARGNAG